MPSTTWTMWCDRCRTMAPKGHTAGQCAASITKQLKSLNEEHERLMVRAVGLRTRISEREKILLEVETRRKSAVLPRFKG